MIGLLLAIDASSQSPQPDTPKSTKNTKQDKRGTKDSPLVVEGIPAKKSKEEADREQEEAKIRTSTASDIRDALKGIKEESERTTLLTLGLCLVAIAQAALFFWQLLMLRKTVNDSRRAALASQQSARAAKDSVIHQQGTARKELRAYVGVKGAFLRLDSTATVSKKMLAKITIINSGRTPAYNASLAIKVEIRDSTKGDFEMTHREGSTYLLPGFQWNAQQATEIDISNALRDELMLRKKYAILWGEVLYEDTYGEKRFSRFRFRQGMFIEDVTSRGWDVYPCEDGNEAR